LASGTGGPPKIGETDLGKLEKKLGGTEGDGKPGGIELGAMTGSRASGDTGKFFLKGLSERKGGKGTGKEEIRTLKSRRSLTRLC